MTPVRPRVRLFVEAGLAAGAEVVLAAGHAHYLVNVMRLGRGDAVLVFNGRDGEWQAEIADAGRRAGRLAVVAETRPQASEPGPWLAFAPLKKAAMDMVVEKATELGAARLIPVLTANTASQRINGARLRAQAVESAEQCGRLTVPEVAEAVALARLLQSWPPRRRLLLLDETGGGRPLAQALAAAPGADGDGFLVGPEGGFRRSELDAIRELPFAVAVGMGPRILRAETAAVAALACWQAAIGDGDRRPPPRPSPD